MASASVYVVGFVVLVLAWNTIHAGVLTQKKYEVDKMLTYKPAFRLNVVSEEDSDEDGLEVVRCCRHCVYVEGWGCVDPLDPSVHPRHHNE